MCKCFSSFHVTLCEFLSYFLGVHCSVLEICDQPADQTIQEGGTLTLLCSSTVRNGQPTYRWLHNNREITLADETYSMMKGELTIERVASHHSGVYECLVELKHSLTDDVILSQKSRAAKIEVNN